MTSLLKLDLERMVLPTFNIDMYDAKAGSNEDIIVLAFRLKTRRAAEDLEGFFEKEGLWVLDADVSSGEDRSDHYLLFVEIQRDKHASKRILRLVKLLETLSGKLRWRFTVGKKLAAYQATMENLLAHVPFSPEQYRQQETVDLQESITKFFSATPFTHIVIEGNIVKLQQYFALDKPGREICLKLENHAQLTESTDAIFESSQAVWLQKNLGHEYIIEQFGDKFLLSCTGMQDKYLISINA